MSKSNTWDPEFTPSYTPFEMIEMGVFEGTYIRAIKGLPTSWYRHPKVLKKGQKPNPELNRFGVKSRLSLKEWEKNGWIKTDKNGWYEWYCRYWFGRRLGEEDKWQIGRWKSFVARHNAQVMNNCTPKHHDCRPRQRQALLQFAWDSDTQFSDKQRQANIKRLSKMSEVSLESQKEKWLNW